MELTTGGVEVKTPVAGEQREYKNYTGMTNITPLKFNPTKQDIIEIKGISADKAQYIQEPVYTAFDNEGNPYMNLTLLYKFSPKEYLEGEHQETIFGNLQFRISRKDILSQAGKFKFANSINEMAWAIDVDSINAEYFNKAEVIATKSGKQIKNQVRKLKENEDLLYSFITALCSKASTKDEPMSIKLSNKSYDDVIEDILSGDVDFLNNVLTNSDFLNPDKSPRRVSVLMGITRSKDGQKKYQTIFTSKVHNTFAKEGRQLSKKVVTDVVTNPLTWKGDFQGVMDFRVYVEKEQPTTMIKEDTATTEATPSPYEGLDY